MDGWGWGQAFCWISRGGLQNLGCPSNFLTMQCFVSGFVSEPPGNPFLITFLRCLSSSTIPQDFPWNSMPSFQYRYISLFHLFFLVFKHWYSLHYLWEKETPHWLKTDKHRYEGKIKTENTWRILRLFACITLFHNQQLIDASRSSRLSCISRGFKAQMTRRRGWHFHCRRSQRPRLHLAFQP